MSRFNVDVEQLSFTDESYEDDEQLDYRSDRSQIDSEEEAYGSSAVEDDHSEEDQDVHARYSHHRQRRKPQTSSRASDTASDILTDSETSDDGSGAVDLHNIVAREQARRGRFAKQIHKIETTGDIKLLYPASLHLDWSVDTLVSDEG